MYSSGADGFKLDHTNANAQVARCLLANNLFSGSGGYDVNFAQITGAGAVANGALILSNDDYNATSGSINPSANTELGKLNLNPSFSNAGAGDFTPTNASLQVAYPSPHPGGS